MKTFTANQYFRLLLDEFVLPGQTLPPEEAAISWPFFLKWLVQFCAAQGWTVEYETPEDYSCAIIACEEVANEQLPLFLDGDAVFAPSHRFMRCD